MRLEDNMLNHIDQNNLPTMVDVTEKDISVRMAHARSSIQLPECMRPYFKGDELILKKGPVIQTAIIAGTMAVKRTHEMIPFCHQIPVESCKFEIKTDENLKITIDCRVKTNFKTGVEMEALHGAMTAALTIYDMCKAISHDMVISETKLISKTGGKRTLLDRPLYGLVLTGGKSERMKKDKALIEYKGKPHAQYIYDLLKRYCDEVYLSSRENQWIETPLHSLPQIHDTIPGKGPIIGILSALEKHPDANWMVVACDLIHFNEKTIEELLAQYDSHKPAIAFKNAEKGFPEPLCTLYTPSMKRILEDALEQDITCPVKVLKTLDVKLIEQKDGINLANINTPDEFAEVVR